MKNFLRISSIIFVAIFVFALTGCGKKDNNNNNNNNNNTNTETTLTTAEVVSLVSGLIDLSDPNFTATINASYEMAQIQGLNRQTNSEALENVLFKIAGENGYYLIPQDKESYQIGNSEYLRYYEDGAWGEFEVFNGDETTTSIGDMTGPMELLLQDVFSNLISFDPDWVTSTKLSSGAYSININADLKPDLIQLKTILLNGGDSTLGELLSDILAIHYGSTMTVEKIISDIKANIDQDSTLGDVIDFLEVEFGFSLTNTYSAIALIMGMEGEANVPALTTNFFELLEIADDTTFETYLDTIYDTYLNNEELTINTLLESAGENSSELVTFIGNLLASLEALTINECEASIVITTNAARDHIASITLSATASITMSEVTMEVSCQASIVFSSIGTTSVVAPTL